MRFIFLFIFLQVFYGASLQGASTDGLGGCAICFDFYPPGDLASWCIDGSHRACGGCLLKYVEGQIRDHGHNLIACPFADRAKTYSSHGETHRLLEECYLTAISLDVAQILSAIKQRLAAVQMGYAPCSTKACGGMIKEGKEGTICEVCQKAYQAETYPADTRHCQFCRGALQKVEGCRRIKCGHCLEWANWEECREAKVYEPPLAPKAKEVGCACLLL